MILVQAFRRQRQAISRHPLTLALILLTVAGVCYLAHLHHEWKKCLAYLSAMWLCALVTDMLTINYKAPELPVRKPLRESGLALLLTGLGMAGLLLRFVWLDWKATPGIWRLAIMPLILLCTFPIVLAAILLLARYKPRDLGFRISPIILAGLPVVGITAGSALIYAPSGLTYQALMKETGSIWGFLLTGFVSAALAEEFMRLVLQTRLGALFNDKALGWYLACAIWASMHIPKWYDDSGDLFESLMGAVRIIPLGLMWSYLIHRCRNIFPSILAHGLNVWGLQNF